MSSTPSWEQNHDKRQTERATSYKGLMEQAAKAPSGPQRMRPLLEAIKLKANQEPALMLLLEEMVQTFESNSE